MSKKTRLTGIDLFKGIAVFAVILLHIDGSLSNSPLFWPQIRQFCSFAVPFFLATAFFLAIEKIYTLAERSNLQPYPLRKRIFRLLMPYACWSIIYLVYKFAKLALTSDFGAVVTLFKDPVALCFFGGASFHLYFLPLLATGTLLLRLSEWTANKKLGLIPLGLVGILSFCIYEYLLVSENEFKVGENIAFEMLLKNISLVEYFDELTRFLLVILSWLLRCLPYIFVSIILAHSDIRNWRDKFLKKSGLLLLVLFIVWNIWFGSVLPESIYEVGRGYLPLLSGIAISKFLSDSRFELPVHFGLISFGIYLVHLIFVEFFQSLIIRIDPGYFDSVSAFSLVFVSTVIFIISWATTALILRSQKASKILLG